MFQEEEEAYEKNKKKQEAKHDKNMIKVYNKIAEKIEKDVIPIMKRAIRCGNQSATLFTYRFTSYKVRYDITEDIKYKKPLIKLLELKIPDYTFDIYNSHYGEKLKFSWKKKK